MGKILLNSSEKARAVKKLQELVKGVDERSLPNAALGFSRWLCLIIEKRLGEIPHWKESAPVALGSWGRGELCPASDLDVIFCGRSQAILKVVRQVEKLGLKLRYRQPQDMEDWTKNVDVMEANALFSAKALTEQGFERLELQKNKILKRKKSFRSRLLKAMEAERKARLKRYDSIANFQEPNIKFGVGGLRDIHQTLILFDWFPERFEDETYALKVLKNHKNFFLLIRQRLHLVNSFDVLTAGDQQDMANWFGETSVGDFTKKLQKALSQVNFYSDWSGERCGFTQKKWRELQPRKLRSWSGVFRLLSENPSLQNQAFIQKVLDKSCGFQKEKISKKKIGRFLKKVLDIRQKESLTSGVFQSGVIPYLVPDFKKVMGLVQHDQYHRFTVDAHLLRTIHGTRSMYKNPGGMGSLEFLAKKLKLSDWNILRWSALYHDLAKGQGGDHHEKGGELVRRDFLSFGFSRTFIDEVSWLVRNHLVLSHGAFRKNPHSVETWKELFSKGVMGGRLYRLAFFTVIDVQATNPEAWGVWKEKLLRQLVEHLINPDRQQFFSFIQKLDTKNSKIPEKFLYRLEPLVSGGLPHSLLLKDIGRISRKFFVKGPELPVKKKCGKEKPGRLKKKEIDIVLVRDRSKYVWVRFHSERDNQELLYSFTGRLTGIGCNIRQAFIHTHREIGAYDWFQLKTKKRLPILRRQLLESTITPRRYPVCFAKIELITANRKEWVFGFLAEDQKGLLLTAIRALYKSGLKIIWARVHTWGNQIDDIFGVLPKDNESPEQVLRNLKKNNIQHKI